MSMPAYFRAQIDAEELIEQDRAFIEDYAERYEIPTTLSSREIVDQIFTEERPEIPILPTHVWHWDDDTETISLRKRTEIPQAESYLAVEQLEEDQQTAFFPEKFPDPPEDTYSPEPLRRGTRADKVTSPTALDTANPATPAPTRMEFVYPPKGRPRRDSKGRVVEGEYEHLSQSWLQDMYSDFQNGRKALVSTLEDLQGVVNETSSKVLGLSASLKKEQKETLALLDSIEQICGSEVRKQIEADARASSDLPAKDSLPKGRVRRPVSTKKKVIFGDNPLPTSVVTVDAVFVPPGPRKSGGTSRTSPSKKRSHEDEEQDHDDRDARSPGSDSSTSRKKRAKRQNRDSINGGDESKGSDDGDDNDNDSPKPDGSGAERTSPSAKQKGKRRAVDVDEDDEQLVGEPESSPPSPAKRPRNNPDDRRFAPVFRAPNPTPRRAQGRVASQMDSAEPQADLQPTSLPPAPAPRGSLSRVRPFFWGGITVETGVHDVEPVFGRDAHPSRRHLLNGNGGSGEATTSNPPAAGSPARAPSTSSRPPPPQHDFTFAGVSSTSSHPRRGLFSPPTRTLTRTYNVVWNQEGQVTELGPARSPQSRRRNVPIGNPIQPPPMGQPVASSSTAAQSRASTSAPVATYAASNVATEGRSQSPEVTASNPAPEQALRAAHWNPPPPPPSPPRPQPRPLRRAEERFAVDPVTGRLVAYDYRHEQPDFTIARAAQAADDIANIRRAASTLQAVEVIEGEGDFIDEEDEEVVLGKANDLPV